VNDLQSPLRSLREGHWFKLICGASFQHLPAVRNLTLAYALAGADCIDVAADPAVVAAAQRALQAATQLAQSEPTAWPDFWEKPWLMVSLNDGEDPHFRKAELDPYRCPSDCSRPCERICPAQAITFEKSQPVAGVIDSLCYGCGRCLDICPINQITTRSYVFTPSAIAPFVLAGVDAVEIHTQIGRLEDFKRLWQAIAPWVPQLKLVAVSCPDGEGLIDYLQSLYDWMAPLPTALIWQTDGRPMSGDIGDGTTRAAVKLGQKVLAAHLPGYVQLAGGTNRHTVKKLRSLGLLAPNASGRFIAGVAYGSYARSLLSDVLHSLDAEPTPAHTTAEGALIARSPTQLEDQPDVLQHAVDRARSLVSQLKAPVLKHPHSPSTAGSSPEPPVPCPPFSDSFENSVYL
jgi:Fe-S-cluster-containing hydrogenase component 2